MQGVSLKLVISADKDHITSVHEVRSTKSQVFSITQQAAESSGALFPFESLASLLFGSQVEYQLNISS